MAGPAVMLWVICTHRIGAAGVLPALQPGRIHAGGRRCVPDDVGDILRTIELAGWHDLATNGSSPTHVSLLLPTRTEPLSQVPSTATAVFATFPRAAVLLPISHSATFR